MAQAVSCPDCGVRLAIGIVIGVAITVGSFFVAILTVFTFN